MDEYIDHLQTIYVRLNPKIPFAKKTKVKTQALKVLQSEGIEHAIVDGGGDIVLSKPYEKYWKVQISDGGDTTAGYIEVANGAVATSGYSYQSIEIDGKRYSHIVDPRNGLGVTENYMVTVYAENASMADAWASAVSVLGPVRGLEVIEKVAGVEVFMMRPGKNGQIFRSSGFPEVIKQK